MKRIILHIGMPKTGTSSLQLFFAANKSLLEKKGVGYYKPLHYYQPWRWHTNADFILQMALAEMGMQKDDSILDMVKEDAQSFKDYSENLDTLLLSDEMTYDMGILYDGFWAALKESVLKSCGDSDASIDVIIYLRRQDEWALSEWKEGVRDPRAFTMDFSSFLKEREQSGHLDYASVLLKLEETFGIRHLIIRPYESFSFYGNSLYSDFLNATDLSEEDTTAAESPDISEYEIPSKLFNTAFTLDTTEAIRMINLGKIDGYHTGNQVYHAAWLFSQMYPEKKKAFPINEAERRDFINKYAYSNRQVANRYLNKDSLFDDTSIDDSIWSPDPANDLKNAQTIIRIAALPQKTQEWMKRNLSVKLGQKL